MRVATCWRIVPRKFTAPTIYLTDHPNSLVLADGQTYLPVGIETSARERRVGFAESDKECRGIVSADALTDELLRAGALLDAEVTEYLVDWFFPWKPPIETLRYQVLEVEQDGDQWVAQVGSIATLLNVPLGDFYGPRCMVDVFSVGPGQCNKSSSGFELVSDVDAVVTPNLEFDTSSNFSAGSWDLEHWRDGKLVWLTGANQGHVSFIREINPSDTDNIVLHEPTPNAIAVGDFWRAFQGCNHQAGVGNSTGDCKNRYANLVNFQGFFFIPGRDRTVQGAPQS
jgi:uncharacterized phage protein (TIGR02218 family)